MAKRPGEAELAAQASPAKTRRRGSAGSADGNAGSAESNAPAAAASGALTVEAPEGDLERLAVENDQDLDELKHRVSFTLLLKSETVKEELFQLSAEYAATRRILVEDDPPWRAGLQRHPLVGSQRSLLFQKVTQIFQARTPQDHWVRVYLDLLVALGEGAPHQLDYNLYRFRPAAHEAPKEGRVWVWTIMLALSPAPVFLESLCAVQKLCHDDIGLDYHCGKDKAMARSILSEPRSAEWE